ncbi:cytosine deaminase [Clostridium oceanicum]|uniref:Cytosine deaminase n=1 Tax=Clostridium oceanicum TaxID=1543 RepID=A0ABN1JFJ3_9CLOT
MLIKNVRLRGRNGLFQILIKNKKIEKIAPIIPTDDKEEIDGKGGLALEPFIEPHIHLDTALTAGEPRWNLSGTLFEGIDCWSERKKYLNTVDVKERAKKTLKWQIANGIQYVRTHIDVTDEKLTALKALLEVKKEMSPFINMQIVAFPQEGVLSYPKSLELLEESLKLGADAVGAIPHYEFTREYGVESIEKIIDLAMKYDKLIDVHCDEIDDDQSRFLEVLATKAYENQIGKRVAASHTTAMHSYNNAYARKLFRILKLSKINFVSNPLVNIHLQGRFDTYPKRRGITRVKELMEEDINVCFGHDDIFDHWYPLGTGNMLEVLKMGLHACQIMGYEDIKKSLDFITINGAKTLNIDDKYGIKEGNLANMIILSEKDEYDVIRKNATVIYSIKEGSIIAKGRPSEVDVLLPHKEKINFDK